MKEWSKSLRACSKTQSFFRFTKLVEEQWAHVRHWGTRLRCPRALSWCGRQQGWIQTRWAAKNGLNFTALGVLLGCFRHICIDICVHLRMCACSSSLEWEAGRDGEEAGAFIGIFLSLHSTLLLLGTEELEAEQWGIGAHYLISPRHRSSRKTFTALLPQCV